MMEYGAVGTRICAIRVKIHRNKNRHGCSHYVRQIDAWYVRVGAMIRTYELQPQYVQIEP